MGFVAIAVGISKDVESLREAMPTPTLLKYVRLKPQKINSISPN